MPRGFPLQDTGPGMGEMFHDLQAEQEEERGRRAAIRKDRERTSEKLRESIRKKQAHARRN